MDFSGWTDDVLLYWIGQQVVRDTPALTIQRAVDESLRRGLVVPPDPTGNGYAFVDRGDETETTDYVFPVKANAWICWLGMGSPPNIYLKQTVDLTALADRELGDEFVQKMLNVDVDGVHPGARTERKLKVIDGGNVEPRKGQSRPRAARHPH
jgi:hypothetical protein